jgi:phosphoglycolate phosphatase
MNTNTPIPLAGLVFDLDGTLIDSAPDTRNALNAFLVERNRRFVTLEETKQALGDGAVKLVERIFRLTGDCPPDIMADVRAYITIYNTIKADPIQIYPDVVTTLRAFKKRNIPLGLCTNKPESATLKLLDELELRPYFAAIAGGDSFPVHKPDPAHLMGVIEQMGITPQGCVMIGDSPNDMVAAHGLGIPCILVDYGYGFDVSVLPAEAVISSMADLPKTLMRLGFQGF